MVSSPRTRKLITLALLIGFSLWMLLSQVNQWIPPNLADAFPEAEMVVGVDASYPPFALDQGGELVGIDIDLARALAEAMGVSVRFVPVGFDGLYDALSSGRVNVVISALIINPAKEQQARFTRPYFDNGLLLVSEQPLERIENVQNQRLALEYGGNAHTQANNWLKRFPPFTLLPYEVPRYALDALRLGQADYALVDTTTLFLYRATHNNWHSEALRVTEEPYAIAIRPDRWATWRLVDSALEELERSGRLETLIQEWFQHGTLRD